MGKEGWDLVGGHRYPVTVSDPRGKYKTTNKYLVGSVDQRSQADRGIGHPGRCHHSDMVHAAGTGSPHVHKGLLWAKAEVGGWTGARLTL